MSPACRTAEPGPEILHEAARWFVLLSSGEASEADRRRWQAWRAENALHEAGWQRAQAACALFSGIPAGQTRPAFDALERRPGVSRGRRRTLGGIAGLFVVAFAGWHGWRVSDRSADHVTAIGEQREIVLADGSRLQLDTDSAVDIAFSDKMRLIRLRRGRLMIATARQSRSDPPPFLVETAEGRIQALGTQFTVQQASGSSAVVVLEARVAIHVENGSGEAPILNAGQAARFNRRGLLERRPQTPADAAWHKGMLVADAMPLGEFIDELARYRRQPLHCAPAVRQLRISGTYPLADTERTLAALADTLPVRVEALRADDPSGGQIVVARK